MKNTIKKRITVADATMKIACNDLTLVKSSYMAGYMCRSNIEGEWYEYNGRYGVGVVHITPCFETSRYVRISYYVQEKKQLSILENYGEGCEAPNMFGKKVEL